MTQQTEEPAGGRRQSVTPHGDHGPMDEHAMKRCLDDVESQLRKAKRAADSGSDVERQIKRALSALDDAQRLLR